ncbi:MAG: nucleotidyltransferase domain-containing protein [Promethearchaeota archaeon]
MVLIQQLRKILQDECQNQLEFAILFGSEAVGKALPISDVDVAIKTTIDNAYSRFQLRKNLISILEGKIKKRIDVVNLEDLPLNFQFEILKSGQVILENDLQARLNYLEKVLILYPDYRIYLDRFWKINTQE